MQRAGGRKPNSICWKTGPGGRSQLCPFLSVTLASPFGALGLSFLSCNCRLPGPQRGLKARIGTSQPLEELLGGAGGHGVLEYLSLVLFSLTLSGALLLRSTLPFFWGQKEILLHVLQYIQHLQRSIDMAKALLQLHTSDGEGGE